MKTHKLFVFVVLLLTSANTYAQKIFGGKIVNNHHKPIIGVSIIALENTEKGTITDSKGIFKIELKDPEVKISSIGYTTKIKTLSSNHNLIILEENREKLDEVLVSATRERQKRKEIAASIGLLTKKQIKVSKAFGIEQLVNQTSGVYMATSKASGNEQHFMATRSPISTKPLFLYLEDGLPIRPVAVFNHNALLEMNPTSFNRIEIIKGPASSIYGSEAIGGSFNFITKNPQKEFYSAFGFQGNSLGITRYEAEASTTIKNRYGFYIGGHHIRRDNGPVGHSDYEKTAISYKNTNNVSEHLKITNTLTFVKYRSDMAGAISEKNYFNKSYKSNQTFTERESIALRFRTSWEKKWSKRNKTSLHFLYRNNAMMQIPSYRIKQDRIQGQLQGTGKGEINSNIFRSYVVLIQHKTGFNFGKSELIVGLMSDYSPKNYEAEKIEVNVNTETGQNINYSIRNNDYILKYTAGILNYAGYLHYEISPFRNLKLTSAIRYDGFSYHYDNLIENKAGVSDTKVSYKNWSPKIGFNLNLQKNIGVYGNYAKGFTPPQVSTLFRNSKNNEAGGTIFNLAPTQFHNYEIGGYLAIPSFLKVDISLYQLNGKNRLLSLRDDVGNYRQKNAGVTRSQGIELSTKYEITNKLSINYNGSYATHKYISFINNSNDYSNTPMQAAPNYLANILIHYKPLKKLLLSMEFEQVGKYNTSFEGEVVIGNNNNDEPIFGTATYHGHSIFNCSSKYTHKNIEIWGHILNVFNTHYAVRASYNNWSKQNTYNIGNPRAIHIGLKYTL